MPSVFPRSLNICARLHPYDQREGHKFGVRFLETAQNFEEKHATATTDVGVSCYDRVFCTLNLFRLFRERGNLLEYIEVEASVDGNIISFKRHLPYNIVERRHVLVTSLFSLERSRGTIKLKVTTNNRKGNTSADYHLVFRYVKNRGDPPIKLHRHEIRGSIIHEPQEEESVRRGYQQPEAKEERECVADLSLFDRMRVSPPEESPLWRESENATHSSSSVIDVHHEVDQRQDNDEHSHALLSSWESPINNARIARRQQETPPRMTPKPCTAAVDPFPSIQTMGMSTQRNDRHSQLQREPDTNLAQITSFASTEASHPSTFAETKEESDLMRLCKVEEARAASLRRQRLLMTAKRKALEEELLAEEEEAKLRELERELSLKRRVDAR